MAYIRKTDIYILLVENKRLFCYALLWGIPFSISCVLGWRLVHEGTVFGLGSSAAAFAGSFLLFLLETAVLSLPAAALASMVMRGGGRKCDRGVPGSEPEKVAEGTVRRPAWQAWLFYSLLIFLSWVPVFLAYYQIGRAHV